MNHNPKQRIDRLRWQLAAECPPGYSLRVDVDGRWIVYQVIDLKKSRRRKGIRVPGRGPEFVTIFNGNLEDILAGRFNWQRLPECRGFHEERVLSRLLNRMRKWKVAT